MNAPTDLEVLKEAGKQAAPAEPVKSCKYGGGRFEVGKAGVSFIGKDNEGNDKAPVWVCSSLDVVAKTRDNKSGEWGRLLAWQDDDRVAHQWAMPLELLEGDGGDMRRELARLGAHIATSKAARDLLATYIKVWPIQHRARCVDRLGWHGEVFITPSGVIGASDESVVFQNAHAIEPAMCVSGMADAWRDSVAALAAGNTRIVFAMSVAFAGSLAGITGEDSGGFHMRGKSSSGKSTALKVAASVWGDPSTYVRQWRATSNGLEGLASLHNDGLLILDELEQVDPREAGEAAYMLGNGQGKARASRTGTARASQRWRLLFLSSGENSLAAHMARSGKKANAGQEIRLADFDADAGCDMGVIEELHGHATPAAAVLAIKDAAAKHHGAVGLAWLHCVVTDRMKLVDFIQDGIRQFVGAVVPAGAGGQVERVARRFGLVAVAGEMATHYGLTGWAQGEADKAAKACFASWLDGFGGTGNREERATLEQVRAFFEAHGSSRFESVDATENQRVINRAGFYRGDGGVREFLVLPEAFKREVCNGLDAKAATALLVKAGWLQRGGDGKTAQKPRLPGMGPTRCYVFTGRMWECEP
jgi:putative DNA primase/helicase